MNGIGIVGSRSRGAQKRVQTLWTSQDVAKFLQVSLRWVEKQCALGVLPVVRLPGQRLVRFAPEEVQTWALKHSAPGRASVR